MNSKKLLTLAIVPLFAIGMTACGPDEPADEDIWTDEGQLPAYETDRPYDDPAYDDPAVDVQRDTLVTPEAYPDPIDEDATSEPQTDAPY